VNVRDGGIASPDEKEVGVIAQVKGVVDLAVAEREPRAVVTLARAVPAHGLRGAPEEIEEPVDHAFEGGE